MNQNSSALPVADLDDVLRQYITAMRPISNKEEMERIEKDVAAFLNGPGPVLQKRLNQYAADLHGKSWLREYSRQRFLSLRNPLTVVGNFTLELQCPSWMASYTSAENSALLAHAVGRLYLKLSAGTIPVPDGNSVSVLDEQMRCVLGSTRIPRPATDDYATFSSNQVRHFGLFHKNHYYLVELFNEHGKLHDVNTLYSAILEILQTEHDRLSVNFHTAAYKGSEVCARLLNSFKRETKNRRNLDLIEKTLFHLSIKDIKRTNASEEQLLFSDTTDLWPYKPWSFTLYTDGALTVNNEHTSSDGMTNTHLYRYVLEFMSDDRQEFIAEPTNKFEELDFFFTNEEKVELEQIRKEYLDSVCMYSVQRWERCHIDWQRWKALGVGRDALVQLGFVFASQSVYGYPRCIHESVSTAQYDQGRTSCLRPATKEMYDVVNNIGSDKTSEEFLVLFRKASKAHSEGIRRAKNNICFVRHGAGLQQMVTLFGKELGIQNTPDLFTSKGYIRFCTQEISTSTLGNNLVKTFAFSPQTPDGIGIGYLAGKEDLRSNISWNHDLLPSGKNFTQSLDIFFDWLTTLQNELAGISGINA